MKGVIGYHVVYKQGSTSEPSSLIVSWVEAQSPLHAVIWSVPRKAWIYAPGPAAGLIYDDRYQDEVKPVDRQTAERIAREGLRQELPSEEELSQICEEGAREGWTWGPPRSD
jgi:hypothetical protein